VSFFHLLNTKEDILKIDGNQTVAVTDCHSMEKNGYHQMFVHQHSSQYLLLCSTDEGNSYRFGTT